MKVSFSRETGETLVITLVPDELDAVPPLERIWIRHPFTANIGAPRLALIAYLICDAFTSNIIELEGVSWPAYLAARAVELSPGKELFVYPVTNVTEKILPVFHYRCLDMRQALVGATPGDLFLRRSEIGYAIHCRESKDDQPVCAVSTNINLLASYVPGNPWLAELVVYLSVFDGLGVPAARLPALEPTRDFAVATRMRLLVSEAGAVLEN